MIFSETVSAFQITRDNAACEAKRRGYPTRCEEW